MTEPEISIVATGTAWIGGGVRSVQSAIGELLNGAENELQLAVYDITDGAGNFVDGIKACAARGLRISFVINRYEDKAPRLREVLKEAADRYSNLELFSFRPEGRAEDLHAKVIIADRSKMLLGSSNLSFRGLVMNHEIAAVISGKAAFEAAKLIDSLLRDRRTVRIGR